MAKKAPPVEEKVEEEEEVTCPVCGKPVGLDVTACPYCGAEFEEEETEEEVVEEQAEEPVRSAKASAGKETEVASSSEDEAECPVCGKMVSLDVSSCPYCGAEFEEEEVEEVIEVEEPAGEAGEEEAAEEAEAPEGEPSRAEAEAVEEEAVGGEEEIPAVARAPLVDLRVIGVALIILGIIGSQISVMIDWYWTWVPPIESHMATFILIPIAVIVVGLVVFALVRRSKSAGKKVPKSAHGASMSVLLFGVLAMIMIALWRPINDALQSSSGTVAGAFLAILVIGILAVFMGSRMTARASA